MKTWQEIRNESETPAAVRDWLDWASSSLAARDPLATRLYLFAEDSKDVTVRVIAATNAGKVVVVEADRGVEDLRFLYLEELHNHRSARL